MAHPVSPTPAPASSAAVQALSSGLLAATGLLWIAGSWAAHRAAPTTMTQLGLLVAAVLGAAAVGELLTACVNRGNRLMHALLCACCAGLASLVAARPDLSLSWLAATVAGYLMLRGAVDVVASLGTHSGGPANALSMVVGIGALLTGFAAAGRIVTTGYAMLVLLGALALVRGLGDLAAAVRLRDAGRPAGFRPDSPTAGYRAGRADFMAARRLAPDGPGRHSAEEADEPVGSPTGASIPAEAPVGVPVGASSAPVPAMAGLVPGAPGNPGPRPERGLSLATSGRPSAGSAAPTFTGRNRSPADGPGRAPATGTGPASTATAPPVTGPGPASTGTAMPGAGSGPGNTGPAMPTAGTGLPGTGSGMPSTGPALPSTGTGLPTSGTGATGTGPTGTGRPGAAPPAGMTPAGMTPTSPGATAPGGGTARPPRPLAAGTGPVAGSGGPAGGTAQRIPTGGAPGPAPSVGLRAAYPQTPGTPGTAT